MKFKDYYKILNVERDATPDQIKKAYRMLARKYHPDVSKETGAEEKFKEIGEAYEVLKDSEKRSAYDQLGTYKPGQEFQPPPNWEQQFQFSESFDPNTMDFGDLFSELFGSAMGGRSSGRRHRRAAPGRDFEVTLPVSLEEAYHGTEKTLHIDVPEATEQGMRVMPRTVKVRIPKGATDGQKLRVPGKGGKGSLGAPTGDLYLNIVVQPHKYFKGSGHDLYLDLPITPWEAALGSSIEVPTMEGKVRLKMPSGSATGKKMRLAGKGLPKPNGGHGDLYVVLQIVLPPKLTAAEQELFEKLAKVSKFTPRSSLESG